MVFLAGCASERTTASFTYPPPQPRPSTRPWVPAISPDQVKALTPDQAKAILLARAALEAEHKTGGYPAPEIMELRATPREDGWEVYVQFVGIWDGEHPLAAPGYFCTITIDRNWNVVRIMGGA
jgi:hypothetical protein